MEEACRHTATMGRGGVARERECVWSKRHALSQMRMPAVPSIKVAVGNGGEGSALTALMVSKLRSWDN